MFITVSTGAVGTQACRACYLHSSGSRVMQSRQGPHLGGSSSSLNSFVCTRRRLVDEVGASSRSRSRICPMRGLPQAAPAAVAAARCGLPLAVVCPFCVDGPPSCGCTRMYVATSLPMIMVQASKARQTLEFGVVSTSVARLRGVRRPRANCGVLVPPLTRLPAAPAPMPASLGVASDRPYRQDIGVRMWPRRA